MGKKGGSSWLSLVKKAFSSSPSKVPDTKISNRRKDQHGQEEEEDEKKRDKKRWLFRRPACGHSAQSKLGVNAAQPTTDTNLSAEQKHAIAVAAATTAAAEAAVATAQAAVEIIRLTRPLPPASSVQSNSTSIKREHYAATAIQTAFRGYLARRALQALKGIVKLQALVRGHNVRKQAKSTLKCMEALLRVQSRVRDQRARLSHEGSRKSMIAESNNQWESSKYYPPQEIRDRKSMSRTRSSLADDWDECPHTLEQLDALLQARKEAAMRHERTVTRAISQQVWDSGRSPIAEGIEREIEERANWLDQWMASKQWENYSRDSSDRREPIKTVEMDMSMPHRYSSSSVQRPQSPHIQHQRQLASPRHRAAYHQPSVTPSPAKIRPLQVRSASPRCFKEEQSSSTANNTPSLVTTRRLSSYLPRQSETSGTAATAIPNYMTATESAKARLRSQSAPRQRPSTPEKERSASAKKRLSYPVPEPYYSSTGKNLRSPSFKSVQAGYVGMELGSNMSSCYTESIGGELSPCSTTELRRWFK